MINAINLLLVKSMTESDVGSQRALQLGVIASMLPGVQGVVLAALIARNEAKPKAVVQKPPPPPPRLPPGDKPQHEKR